MNTIKQVIAAGILGAFLIISGTVQAEVQTPSEIVQAEVDAGNIGKRLGNITLESVEVVSENEVVYKNFFHGFQMAYLNSIEPSIVNAIEASAQDFENVRGGVLYTFEYTTQNGSFMSFTIGNID